MKYVAYLVLRRLRAPLIALIVVWSLSVLGYVLIPGVDNNGNTCSRGTDSTRVNKSEQSSGADNTILMEQDPIMTVVTP